MNHGLVISALKISQYRGSLESSRPELPSRPCQQTTMTSKGVFSPRGFRLPHCGTPCKTANFDKLFQRRPNKSQTQPRKKRIAGKIRKKNGSRQAVTWFASGFGNVKNWRWVKRKHLLTLTHTVVTVSELIEADNQASSFTETPSISQVPHCNIYFPSIRLFSTPTSCRTRGVGGSAGVSPTTSSLDKLPVHHGTT